MNEINEVALVAGMVAVTFVSRYPVLAMVGRMPLPMWALRALKFVPPAVLTAIIVPFITLKNGDLALRVDNSYLIAGVVAALIAFRTKNLLLTIIGGMITLWVWRLLLGGL
ncbi:MAG TPA: AzlD domain-containing protein [Aggregatilineales bacterium]|nr:AzlD domain-containing protein [Anaerolineales bacterium]HRE46094.1 AzlD domain-containing protein [Aggregatilineales bacterium]